MMHLKNRFLIWFIIATLATLVACVEEDRTPTNLNATAIPTVTAVSDAVETAEPTATTAQTPTVVLPTAAATESPVTPVALCPAREAFDLAWECEEDSRDGVRYCTAVDPDQNLACYEDMVYPFALLLPANWQRDATVYQRLRITNRDQFVKDHDFIFYEDEARLSGSGGVKISVFVPREATLTGWLAVKQRSIPEMILITEPNIQAAGRPAALWPIDCSPQWYREIHVAVHDGEHLLWWRHYAFNEAGILALRQMLDELRFGEEMAVPVEIPDEIWQEALQGCW